MSTDWLTEMVGTCRLEGVGAVGAKLLYADGRIQHAGVTLGVHGLTGHAFEGRLDRFAPVEVGFYAHIPRDVSAVTAACLLTRRDTYLEVGGFDEEALAVAWNDTDFCLRLRARGWRVVMNPLAELIHLGSASRGEAKNDREVQVMFARWGDQIARDPYYNPNLTRLADDFSPRVHLDERPYFHYSPAGFRAHPPGPEGEDATAPEALCDGALREICASQASKLDQMSAELARYAAMARLQRLAASSPIFSRLHASPFLRRVVRRLRRSSTMRRWMKRSGFIP